MGWIWVSREVWKVPDEAREIAESFRKKARETEDAANMISKLIAELKSPYVWYGNSQAKFMDSFEHRYGDLMVYAQKLRTSADKIEKIKVKVSKGAWEWKSDGGYTEKKC